MYFSSILTAGISLPLILSHPLSTHDALPGSSASLVITFDSKRSGELHFEWFHHPEIDVGDQLEGWVSLQGGQDDHVQGASSPSLLITQLSQSDAGSYKCVVSNSVGSTESLPATITVGKTIKCMYSTWWRVLLRYMTLLPLN